jgi:RND superfamily putative drug exporter
VLLLGGVPLVALAAQARRLETSLPRADWLPPRMESARALADLAAMDRAGVAQAVRVVVELPPRTSALEPDGWAAVARVGRALAADPRVGRVQSLPGLVPLAAPGLLAASFIPADVRRAFVSRDQRLALVDVLPASAATFPAVTRLVRDLRARDAAALTGVPGARLRVGGMPAFNADYEDAVAGRMGAVVALVAGGTLVALALGFRSVLVPLKAVALNLASVAAALGAVVLVFQEGRGGALLGAPAALGGLFPALPALVFCLVFGLSMDYEVFLVARVAEARRAGLGEHDALGEGLARTGGVITSAAGVMVAVFAAFVLGDFLVVKVLGFALAAAVLLDATVVRLAVGPALLALAGRWNWWPGRPPGAASAPAARGAAPAPTERRVGA